MTRFDDDQGFGAGRARLEMPRMPRTDETPPSQRQVLSIHPAGPEHRVVTIAGTGGRYCRRPCAECPWRIDATVGEFPPQAFRHSAVTACNLAVRLAIIIGRLRYDELDDIANGVAPDDPALAPCRD